MPSTRPQRPYNVSYYQRNRQREIDRVMSRQRTTLEFLRDLRRVPCEECGETLQPHQMDFDHRDRSTKSFGLTWARSMLTPRPRLLEEVAKCDIICANCHAIRTYAQQADLWWRRRGEGMLIATSRRESQRERATRRRDLILALRDRPCADCGKRLPPYILQFDHRDFETKAFNVTSSWCRSESAILREAAKCDIVCPNCHRDRTFGRRQGIAGVAQFGSERLPSKQ